MSGTQEELPRLLAFLEQVQRLPVKRLFFAQTRPLPTRRVMLHPYARLLLPLTGEKPVCFSDGKKEVRQLLLPGEAVFGLPGAWIEELWMQPHQM